MLELEYILDKLVKKISKYSPKKHKKLYSLLYFVSCVI